MIHTAARVGHLKPDKASRLRKFADPAAAEGGRLAGLNTG